MGELMMIPSKTQGLLYLFKGSGMFYGTLHDY